MCVPPRADFPPIPHPEEISPINFLLQGSIHYSAFQQKHLLVPYFVADTAPSMRDTFSRHRLQLNYQVILDA